MLALRGSAQIGRIAPSPRSKKLIVVRAQDDAYAPITESSSLGSKVEKWLKTPFDLAAFGPRATFGALVSMPERLQTLQSDVEKFTELLQDPRPVEEKQKVVLEEVEDTVVDFLEKGAIIEADVLTNLKMILPPEFSERLSEWIPEPPLSTRGFTSTAPSDETLMMYDSRDVKASQVASEMSEIKNAVTGLKTALDAVRTNNDVSRASIVRMNLREARDMLARRLDEISPATSDDGSVMAASREAKILLDEVDAQFF